MKSNRYAKEIITAVVTLESLLRVIRVLVGENSRMEVSGCLYHDYCKYADAMRITFLSISLPPLHLHMLNIAYNRTDIIIFISY